MEFWSKFFDSIAFFQKAIFIFGQNLFHDSQLYQQMAFPEKRMTISDITEERPEFIEGRPAVISYRCSVCHHLTLYSWYTPGVSISFLPSAPQGCTND